MLAELFTLESNSKKVNGHQIIDRLLDDRPTLQNLQMADSLKSYLDPVFSWSFQPHIFPKAGLLLDLITREISCCYGDNIAQTAKDQLEKNFTVETGTHISLPRLHDRASLHSSAINNINTLIFQSILYSAAAHLNAGHSLHISCSTGRISLTNPNSGAYFQADKDHLIRLQPNKWKDTPQFLTPPLTSDGFEKSFFAAFNKKHPDKEVQKRAEHLHQSILEHPSSFSRQVATANARLYNDVLPINIRQVSIDYELFAIDFLIDILSDHKSATYQLFSTPEGLDFLLKNFGDIDTGWPCGTTPFKGIKHTGEGLHHVLVPYDGSLAPADLCASLSRRCLLPRTALLFLLFLLEGGLAPVGGMMQTLYATQIRDRTKTWLKKNRPSDSRIDVLSLIPTDRATLTPLWAVKTGEEFGPIDYREALSGWKMDEKVVSKLLQIKGSDALKAGAALMNNYLYADTQLDESVRLDMLGDLASRGKLVSLPI